MTRSHSPFDDAHLLEQALFLWEAAGRPKGALTPYWKLAEGLRATGREIRATGDFPLSLPRDANTATEKLSLPSEVTPFAGTAAPKRAYSARKKKAGTNPQASTTPSEPIKTAPGSIWANAKLEQALRDLSATQELSAKALAGRLSTDFAIPVSRNAVIGRLKRLGLPLRPDEGPMVRKATALARKAAAAITTTASSPVTAALPPEPVATDPSDNLVVFPQAKQKRAKSVAPKKAAPRSRIKANPRKPGRPAKATAATQSPAKAG